MFLCAAVTGSLNMMQGQAGKIGIGGGSRVTGVAASFSTDCPLLLQSFPLLPFLSFPCWFVLLRRQEWPERERRESTDKHQPAPRNKVQ